MNLSRDEIALLLRGDPKVQEEFEVAYMKTALPKEEKGFFQWNSREASQAIHEKEDDVKEDLTDLEYRIVRELLGELHPALEEKNSSPVTMEEMNRFSPLVRPQLSGNLMKVDISTTSYPIVLEMYGKWLETGDICFYHMFRQGLDILDLDPVLYEIIGRNTVSIGYWFPKLQAAVEKQDFFQVPETKIIKVPMTLLQLAHTDYFELTPSTLRIVDAFCMEAFQRDVKKTYFIKTGTYSSKFDFRNCKVSGEKEVQELGEYLLFIHHQALEMASPLSEPCIYGACTTNEWCVREYIEPKPADLPTIYHGLPLRNELRCFVDFDTKEVIGMSPYWEPELMKNRFSKSSDADTPDKKHDYVICTMREPELMRQYEATKDLVTSHLADLLPDIELTGQWSIDVMQNGDDFYIIDMATAQTSALRECIPSEKRRDMEEHWLPELEADRKEVFYES